MHRLSSQGLLHSSLFHKLKKDASLCLWGYYCSMQVNWAIALEPLIKQWWVAHLSKLVYFYNAGKYLHAVQKCAALVPYSLGSIIILNSSLISLPHEGLAWFLCIITWCLRQKLQLLGFLHNALQTWGFSSLNSTYTTPLLCPFLISAWCSTICNSCVSSTSSRFWCFLKSFSLKLPGVISDQRLEWGGRW